MPARLLLLLALMLPASSWAQTLPPAPQPIREGAIERLILDDGRDVDAAAWVPAEAQVAVDMKHARRGDSALRFHVDVNWSTGEPEYPVGWPRMQRMFSVTDWRGWEFLEFSVYVESSRTTLPPTPMGLGIYGAGDRTDYARSLTELKLGAWTDYRLPLTDLPSLNPRRGLQFHIAEAGYRDGDRLDFWIDNISLVRYTEPTLTDSHLAEQALYADSKYLLVDLALLGVPQGQQATIQWTLSKAATAVASGSMSAAGGRSRVSLPLTGKPLAPGDYQLAIACGGQGPPPFPVRVVASPWQEGRK